MVWFDVLNPLILNLADSNFSIIAQLSAYCDNGTSFVVEACQKVASDLLLGLVSDFP